MTAFKYVLLFFFGIPFCVCLIYGIYRFCISSDNSKKDLKELTLKDKPANKNMLLGSERKSTVIIKGITYKTQYIEKGKQISIPSKGKNIKWPTSPTINECITVQGYYFKNGMKEYALLDSSGKIKIPNGRSTGFYGYTFTNICDEAIMLPWRYAPYRLINTKK